MSKLLVVFALILLIGIADAKNIVKRQEAAEDAGEDANAQQIAETDNQEAAATADTGATAVDTTNTADTSAAANITLDETFISQALEVHNELRDLHGVPRLVHNPQLSQLAQVHADYLADNRLLVNSVKIYNGDQIGENLLYIQDANPDMYAGDRATLQWYAYGKNFDFSKDFQYEATPFSQIIWSDTKEVGFGISKTARGEAYIVADYYPAGNVIGSFAYNVFQPKPATQTNQ